MERRCRWLLLAYPAWYRRKRAGEMLGTLLEASPPGRRWPSFRDARALVAGGLRVRVRSRVWWLSMLWVVLGAAGSIYFFLVSMQPYTSPGYGNPVGPGRIPVILVGVGGLAALTWLALIVPLLIVTFMVGGLHQLGNWRRPRCWLRAAAWVCAWAIGLLLMHQAYLWGEYPNGSKPSGPAIVSWGELAICAAWLALGAMMTWILGGSPHGRDVPELSRKISPRMPSADDLQT